MSEVIPSSGDDVGDALTPDRFEVVDPAAGAVATAGAVASLFLTEVPAASSGGDDDDAVTQDRFEMPQSAALQLCIFPTQTWQMQPFGHALILSYTPSRYLTITCIYRIYSIDTCAAGCRHPPANHGAATGAQQTAERGLGPRESGRAQSPPARRVEV
eukprot:SAG22_NODE_64_length_23238_cov_83.185566_15_plen_158_part_00